jgi:acyl-CoA synthetase (AMP-forming)/AMP-acid ligase II
MQIFLPSTRLSDEAYSHVFKEVKCTQLLFSQEKFQIASRLKTLGVEMKFQKVPSVADIFSGQTDTDQFKFSKTYDEMMNEVAFMIHSSGTTGTYEAAEPDGNGTSFACDLKLTVFKRHA